MTPEPLTDLDLIVKPRAHGRIRPWSHVTVWTFFALIAVGLASYHWRFEGWRENMIFAAAITTALIAGLTFLSRRALFSIAVIAAILAMVVIAADVKRRYIAMVLHAYDVVFYLTSLSTLRFLWVDHMSYLLAIVFAFAATVALAVYLYKADSSRIARPASGAIAIA